MDKDRKVLKPAISFLTVIFVIVATQEVAAQWRLSSDDCLILSELSAKRSGLKFDSNKGVFGMGILQSYYDYKYRGKSPSTLSSEVGADASVKSKAVIEMLQKNLRDLSKYFSKEDLEKILKEYPIVNWSKEVLTGYCKGLFDYNGVEVYASRPYYSIDNKTAIVHVTGKAFSSAYIYVFENGKWVEKAQISPFA